MTWEMGTTTTQTARKDYHCQASDWILNAGLSERDYDPVDWAELEKAKSEGWKILKGTEYIKMQGKWDGEFSTFRARPELNAICQKYDLYFE